MYIKYMDYVIKGYNKLDSCDLWRLVSSMYDINGQGISTYIQGDL